MVTIPSLTYTLTTLAFPEGLTFRQPEVTIDPDDISAIFLSLQTDALPDGTVPGNRAEIYLKNTVVDVERIDHRSPEIVHINHRTRLNVMSLTEDRFETRGIEHAQIVWPEWFTAFLEENGYSYQSHDTNPAHESYASLNAYATYSKANNVDIFTATGLDTGDGQPQPLDIDFKDILRASATLHFEIGDILEDTGVPYWESSDPIPDRITLKLYREESEGSINIGNFMSGTMGYQTVSQLVVPPADDGIERQRLQYFEYSTGNREWFPPFLSTVEAVRIGDTFNYKIDLSTLNAPPIIKAFFEYDGFDVVNTSLAYVRGYYFYPSSQAPAFNYFTANDTNRFEDMTINLLEAGGRAAIVREGFRWNNGAATFSHFSTDLRSGLPIWRVKYINSYTNDSWETSGFFLQANREAALTRFLEEEGDINITINNAAGGSLTPFTELDPFYQDRLRSTVERVLMETDGVTIRQWALESDLFHTSLETMDLNELVDILSHVALVGR